MRLILIVNFLLLRLSHGANIAPSGPQTKYLSEYWTAFLNITYVDPARKIIHTERTETARYSSYGPGVPMQHPVVGVAIEVTGEDPDDLTGCNPPFNMSLPAAGVKWIAVLRRGGCQFTDKIRNVMKYNASGAVIYDNSESAFVQTMKVEADCSIPAVATYKWKGEELVALIRKFPEVTVKLEKGSHCRIQTTLNNPPRILYCTPHDNWEDLEKILKKDNPYWMGTNFNLSGTKQEGAYNVEKRTSVLFVSVSFIVLMIISLAWLIFYYVQRFRYIHAKDQLERKLCSQAKKALAIISTNVVKKDDLEMKDFSETCAVCIETYRVADVIRILPCKHQFHKTCIDQWLLEKRTCPMCKMDILKHYGLVAAADDNESEETMMNLA